MRRGCVLPAWWCQEWVHSWKARADGCLSRGWGGGFGQRSRWSLGGIPDIPRPGAESLEPWWTDSWEGTSPDQVGGSSRALIHASGPPPPSAPWNVIFPLITRRPGKGVAPLCFWEVALAGWGRGREEEDGGLTVRKDDASFLNPEDTQWRSSPISFHKEP